MTSKHLATVEAMVLLVAMDKVDESGMEGMLTSVLV